MAITNQIMPQTEAILLVDDGSEECGELSAILRDAGYRVRLSGGRSHALESALAQPPFLALIAAHGEETDGLALCRELKRDERTRAIPVILLIDREDRDDRDRCFAAGAADYIAKPLVRAEVLARVSALRELRGVPAERTEGALPMRDLQLRMLIEHLHSGLVVHAPDTSILLANLQASALLGLSIDQMMGKVAIDPAWRFIDADGVTMPVAAYPVNRVLATREAIRDLVLGVYRPSGGDQVWVLVNAYPQLGPDGDLQQVVVTFVDITERKRAEDALRASEQRYALLFQGSPALLSIQRVSDTRFVEVNAAWQALTGYTRAEALSLPSSALNLWTDVARREKLISELIEQGTSRAEVQIRHKSGAIRDVLLSSEIVEISGEDYLQTMGQDITEIKQAQARIETQMQKLVAINAIDSMIANAHDLQLTLKAIVETASTELAVDATAILLFMPPTNTLEFSTGYGIHAQLNAGTHLRLDECYAGRAVTERRRVHIQNLAALADELPCSALIAGEGFVDYMGVPLIAKGVIKGVLELYHRVPLHPEDDWLSFLGTLSGQAAIAIDSAQAFEGLQRAN
ncbi:PAS domain S-box protein, partial [Oscillochloris sp. ZM17-4]|uniref:PAS domain S-box protein n=1 Tax=Oscillochloris sp. ZM17-4 TaxID=2866714 RepID=UPI001C72D250